MSTFSKLLSHVVFSTKYRRRVINTDIQERLYEYIGGVIRNNKGSLIEIGGVEDHVHILAHLPANRSVSDSIRDLKANSSKWINESVTDSYKKFAWQKGYGAFTVSFSQVGTVKTYIQNQREHHRTKSFKEEFIELLKRHNIEYDEKYLFEAEHTG